MIVGFTGTARRPLTSLQRAKLTTVLHELCTGDYPQLHHGDAIHADETAAFIAAQLGYCVVSHPPSKDKLRANSPYSHVIWSKAPYRVRNRELVKESDVLVACPGTVTEYVRSGTWATVRYARAKGIRIIVIYPNGLVKEEL